MRMRRFICFLILSLFCACALAQTNETDSGDLCPDGSVPQNCLLLASSPCDLPCAAAQEEDSCEPNPCGCAANWTTPDGESITCSIDLKLQNVLLGQTYTATLEPRPQSSEEHTLDGDDVKNWLYENPEAGVDNFAMTFTASPANGANFYVRKTTFGDAFINDWSSEDGAVSNEFNWERDVTPKLSRPSRGQWHVRAIVSQSATAPVQVTIRVDEAEYNAAPQRPFVNSLLLLLAAAALLQ